MLLSLILSAAPLWPAPKPAEIVGCQAAACTEQASQKICKCVPVETEGGDARPGMVIEGPGARHLEWDARAVQGEVTDFVVQSVDLDGDEKPEVLIASRAAESSMPMIRDWELAIVDGENDTVTHLLAQDWGPDSLSARKLLLTEWAMTEGQIVFTGREYTYDNGTLEPADAPVKRRALGPAFEKERLAAINSSANRTLTPRAFLSHASTKQGVDVVPKALVASLVKGVAREEPWLQVHVQGPNGKVEMLSGHVEGKATLRLGDVKRKRLFPLGYAPSNAESWLVGRSVWRAEGQIWVN